MDMKLELVAVPVSDVDRAKAFYVEQVGFHPDHDHEVSDEIRFVQLTPPGSACSIALGKGITDAPPGAAQGIQIVVADIEAAHAELGERGVEILQGPHRVAVLGDFEIWMAFFEDTEGNTLAVTSEKPVAPAS